MTGKLNGVIPATTPTGCSIVWTSTPGRHLRGCGTLQKVRDAAGELDVLESPSDLAPRVVEYLAVLAGDRRRQVVPVGGEEFTETEEEIGPWLSEDEPQSSAALTATATVASTSAADASATSALCVPAAGSKTGSRPARMPATARPSTQCPIVIA